MLSVAADGTLANDESHAPSISSDGRFIAFSSNRDFDGQNVDGNFEIFVFDSLATSFAQLTNSSGIVGCTDAKISGNGDFVAYIRDNGTTPGATRDLIEQTRLGGSVTVLADQWKGKLLNAVTPGECVGEMVYARRSMAPRSATVTAIEMSWVLGLRIQDIDSFSDPCRARFSEAFLSVMADRLSMLGGRLVSLMQEQKVGII
jgi:uncharacterized membrane protein